MKAALILGGGPAGCQAALWLKLLGYDPILLETSDRLGGLQARSPYPNEWLVGLRQERGIDLAISMQRHIESLNIDVHFNTAISELEIAPNEVQLHNHGQRLHAQYLIIATGVRPRKDYLIANDNVLIGPSDKVINYDYGAKRVAILGGGDNAIEHYTFIQQKNPDCCHVYAKKIIARHNLYRYVNPDHVYLGSYEVDQANMEVWHQSRTQAYDVILVFYGYEPNLFCGLNAYKTQLLADNGYIWTDEQCRTRLPRVFAVGEVANRMHPCVITAMADGVVAAKAIQQEIDAR